MADDPRSLSDAALVARALELHRLTAMAEAARRGLQPTESNIGPIMRNWTIAILEISRGGETIHLVTANRKAGYDRLRENPGWLRAHERVVGEHIPYYRLADGRRSQLGIDAEQVAAYAARDLKVAGSAVRIAASRPICVACADFFSEFLRQVRLINPHRDVRFTPQGTQPPRTRPPRPPLPRGLGGPVGGAAFTPRQRGAAGAVLVVQALNALIGAYVSRREEARYEAAVMAKSGFLRDFQEGNPTVGVLVTAYFDGALFSPPLGFSYGMTEVQARRVRALTASVRQGSAAFSAWLPPLQEPDVTSLRPPLAPVFLATFYRRQVFQNLQFRVFDGFDDEGETDLGYPQRGKEACFWILRPPAILNYEFGGVPDTKEVDVFKWPLVSGEVVECVDLDPTPLSRGSDCAFPAFPADVATDVTFSRAPAISDKVRALRNYDFEHVRWIAPHRAHSIGAGRPSRPQL